MKPITLEEEISSAEEIDIYMKLGNELSVRAFQNGQGKSVLKNTISFKALSLEGARYVVKNQH